MRTQSWFSRPVAATACVVALAATGCGKQSDEVTAGTTSAKDAPSESSADNLGDFCLAIAALDQTDGTTDPSVVLPAIEALREAAPAEIQLDVNLISDTLIVNSYPEGTEPSMKPAPFDELDPARDRVAAYVETHC